MVSIHVKGKIFHFDSVNEEFTDKTDGKGSNFTHWNTLAQLPNHCEMDSLYLWCISHWEKPTELPSLKVFHGVFYGGDSAAFEKSQSPQWEETALKWWEESLGAVAEGSTHTHTPEYSLQLQRRNSRPKIIQYCLSCSVTIGCFSKMQQQNQNRHHQWTSLLSSQKAVSANNYIHATATATQESGISSRWIIKL